MSAHPAPAVQRRDDDALAPGPQRRRRDPRSEADRWKHRSRSTKKVCKYPYKLIDDARAMRANEYTYVEIAKALEQDYKIKVPWITVRDWCCYYYRVIG